MTQTSYYTNRGRPRNKRDLIRISTHIPKEHHELLLQISDEEDLSAAQVIRRAIELYLLSQQDVLGINESEMTIAKHISETRSKKAQLISHVNKFDSIRRNMELDPFENDLLDVSADSLFQELNPDAF